MLCDAAAASAGPWPPDEVARPTQEGSAAQVSVPPAMLLTPRDEGCDEARTDTAAASVPDARDDGGGGGGHAAATEPPETPALVAAAPPRAAAASDDEARAETAHVDSPALNDWPACSAFALSTRSLPSLPLLRALRALVPLLSRSRAPPSGDASLPSALTRRSMSKMGWPGCSLVRPRLSSARGSVPLPCTQAVRSARVDKPKGRSTRTPSRRVQLPAGSAA